MDIEQVMCILIVEDMDRMADFYENAIGFGQRVRSPLWSEPTFGDFTLALHIGTKGDGKQTGLSFTVDDLDEACKVVEQGGGRVLTAPADGDIPNLRLAVVADPEGNPLELGHHTG